MNWTSILFTLIFIGFAIYLLRDNNLNKILSNVLGF